MTGRAFRTREVAQVRRLAARIHGGRQDVSQEHPAVAVGVLGEGARGQGARVLNDAGAVPLRREEPGVHVTADADDRPPRGRDLAGLVQGILPSFNWTAPDPRVRSITDLRELARWGRIGLKQRKHLADLAFLFSTSATQFLSERFESEHVKAALGWHAINDSVAGPSTAGTAYVLLHDHASEEVDGGVRQWGFVRGGMGLLTETMAEAAREAGCEIRCDAEVERVLTTGGCAVGVQLANGEELRASHVLSNADPKRTFLTLCERNDLPDDFVARIEAYRCMGTSIKINLALRDLPYV